MLNHCLMIYFKQKKNNWSKINILINTPVKVLKLHVLSKLASLLFEYLTTCTKLEGNFMRITKYCNVHV